MWSEIGKQSIQAKKVHYLLFHYDNCYSNVWTLLLTLTTLMESWHNTIIAVEL